MSKRGAKKRERPRRPERRRQRFLPLALGMTGGIAVSVAAFVFFHHQAERVIEGKADALDRSIMEMVHQVKSERFTRVMRSATSLGEHAVIGGFALMTAVRMRRSGRRHDAWTVVISTAGAIALNTALKAIFRRDRPEIHRLIRLPKSHSFPSGHSLLSAASYPIVIHHLVQRSSRRVQVIAHTAGMVLVGSIGFSRVYFGVHFPSDVLAGFAAGFGWLGMTSLTHTLIDRQMSAENAHEVFRHGRMIPPA
jgi:membrane-associated phospholipid phosphatase